MEPQPNNPSLRLSVDEKLIAMVTDAEIDINTTADVKRLDVADYEHELNAYFFTTEASRTQKLIGKVAIGREIHDVLVTEEYDGFYADIAIRGFEIHRTEEGPYHAFIKFDIPVFETSASSEPTSSYYIRPKHIILMYESPEQIMDEMIESLKQNARYCYSQLGDFSTVPFDQKDKLLNQLAHSSGEPFMRRFEGKEISIGTPRYYSIEYDKTGPYPFEMRTNLPDKYAFLSGTVQSCLFIEQVVCRYQTKENRYAQALELNEPCIVLVDEKAIARYLIPISQVRDVLEL